jgi:steroid 5-alpha reductase family enzyme
MQAVLLFAVSSPAQVGILASPEPSPIPPLAWAGFALWSVGVFFEWVGDWQLTRFKADPANHGKVLDTGLWRYTRHPNYFGDFAAWWGIWLACAAAGWQYAAATVIGPLFLSFTLTKWSGVTLLEKGLDKSKGDKYADYKRRTSAFFPMPPRN